MSEMRRLRDETQSPLVRVMLASGDADRSENGACDRALGALGLAAAGTVTASAAAKAVAAAASGAKGAGTLSIAPNAAKGGALLLIQWIGIGTLGGAVAIGSAPYAQRVIARATSSTSASHAAPSPVGPVIGAGARSLGESPVHPLETPAAAPTTEGASQPMPGSAGKTARPTGDAKVSAAPAQSLPEPASSAAVSADSVRGQLESLGAIRAVLGSGAPQRALTLLDDFVRVHPSSPMSEEVTVLRIDALVDAGRRAEATAIADAFLAAHPSSAYAQRLRSKLKSP